MGLIRTMCEPMQSLYTNIFLKYYSPGAKQYLTMHMQPAAGKQSSNIKKTSHKSLLLSLWADRRNTIIDNKSQSNTENICTNKKSLTDNALIQAIQQNTVSAYIQYAATCIEQQSKIIKNFFSLLLPLGPISQVPQIYFMSMLARRQKLFHRHYHLARRGFFNNL